MKPLLYYLVFVSMWALTSCSPQWHLRRAIAKGLKIDSTRTEKTDSATIHGLQASGEQDKQVNIDSLLQNCRELLAAAQNEKPAVSVINAHTADQIKKKIQRTVCPQESIDSTYTGTLSIQGKIYAIPLHVVIKAQDGHLKWMVKLGEVKATFVKEEVNTAHLQSGDTWWKDRQDNALGFLVCAVVCFVIWVWVRFRGWI